MAPSRDLVAEVSQALEDIVSLKTERERERARKRWRDNSDWGRET